jgi:DNA-binding response OmpR family regulator
MLIEDDADLREQLCDLLDLEGYEPLPQKAPETALASLRSGVLPAVIVLDLALPGMGGTGFLGTLRGLRAPWSRCPVLLLSGWGGVERLGLAVDMAMRKPPDPVSLARAVDRLAARGARWAPGGGAGADLAV